MSKILTFVLILGLVFGLTGCIGGDGNGPPSVPTVNMPSEAKVDEEVMITVRASDPDGDRIAYKVRFGDGTDSDWSDYVPSGDGVVFAHEYKEVGDYRVKAIASDRKDIGEWSDDKWIRIKTSQPPRVMSILWNGCQKWAEEYGGTHIIGFSTKPKPDWYEGFNVKLISYLKYLSLDEIRAYVRKWKGHPNNGGYWTIEGHEPDITGGDMNDPETVKAHKELRIAQYRVIREEDPDAWGHPVIIFYNCTGAFNGYPGWQNAFPTPEEGVDCDIYAGDFYANRCDGTTDYPGLERAANNLVAIGLERSDKQYIPCLGAFVNQGCQVASLLEQWEWWQEWYENREGEKLRAVAFYFSGMGSFAEGVYDNEQLGQEAREINRRLGLR